MKGWPRQKLRQKNPARLKNLKGQSRQKIGEKIMGVAKIPKMTSWAHGMEKRKEKEKKKKKERKMMTISKDNEWMVLSLFILKDDKLFL